MKNRVLLSVWLGRRSQDDLAKLTGFTQGGISKMSRSKRTIYVSRRNEKIVLVEDKVLSPPKNKNIAGGAE